MNDSASNAAQLSQFETNGPHQRVVLLGASNLSIKFPMVVRSALKTLGGPLELFVAKGFGRSYGQDSKFFGKKFSGILQCGLWDALSRAPSKKTFALVADIGNDLAYGASDETILGWVETVLDRLAAHDAQVVLNNIPLASLRGVGRVRYHAFRELLFPSCKIPRGEMLRRAELLSTRLEEVAAARKMPIFSAEASWYGLDPIHPRSRASGEIWQRMFAGLSVAGGAAAAPLHDAPKEWMLRRLPPERWTQFGVPRRAEQPAARFSDGTTVAIY